MIKLKSGNAKLHKSIGVFNIPAGQETCNRECQGCYAIKAQKRFPVVLASRQRNLEASRTSSFEVDTGKYKMVRIHEAGDFYEQDYVNKWVHIAKANPGKIFYAYTKRMADFDFSEMLGLPNFVLHNSLLDDSRVNYSKRPEELGSGFICPDTLGEDVKCGLTCTWCMQKQNQGIPILFKMH